MYDVFYTGKKPNLFPFEQPVTTVEQAQQLSRTPYAWVIDGANDYSKFNFNFKPVPWEAHFTHVWSSQHQRNGGTVLVPKQGDIQWHYLQTPSVQRVDVPEIYFMDFFNPEADKEFDLLQKQYPHARRIRYVDSHLNVFKRICNLAKTPYVWIISSICDYSNFDFTWHPAQWQEHMIHCFPSGNQQRGDTFYLSVSEFKKQEAELEILDWFNVINYCSEQRLIRHTWPTVFYSGDNLVQEIKNHQFTAPYSFFSNLENVYAEQNICMWREKDREIVSFTRSNATCIVPKDAKSYIKTQVYDYPYINTEKNNYFREDPLDIVYISNGEPNEEEYWDILSRASYAKSNERRWIRGVDGRQAAYQAAARASTTPWFFAVFAKLRVEETFRFDWQPDYFQEPKHYIFHAKNSLNGLQYGHMAMIAYNRDLILNTKEIVGLDYTLSAPHQVVPLLSGVAEFNQDEWTTWRTAFREVLKLKYFTENGGSIETHSRLKTWSTVANGKYADVCLKGAKDALAYYDEVDGDYEKLMLSFEWSWLRDRFNK